MKKMILAAAILAGLATGCETHPTPEGAVNIGEPVTITAPPTTAPPTTVVEPAPTPTTTTAPEAAPAPVQPMKRAQVAPKRVVIVIPEGNTETIEVPQGARLDVQMIEDGDLEDRCAKMGTTVLVWTVCQNVDY